MRGQAGLLDVDERLKRLSCLDDQLLAFTAAVEFDVFQPELTRALAYSDGSQDGRPPLPCRAAIGQRASARPGRARQFVRGVASERDEVRHLVCIDAISLPGLFGPDAREFATRRRVEDRRH